MIKPFKEKIKPSISWSLLEKKKILILGFGKEGQSTFDFLRNRFSKKVIGIADEKRGVVVNDPRVRTHFGKYYLNSIKKYDIIIKSPGIPISSISSLAKRKILTSQSDIFLNLCKERVIGVTGTKGKTGTCMALKDLLEEKENVHLVGNIGNPALDQLDKKGVFIYELSSFQLETITKSPHIAVFLNLYKDHLDNHQNFESYLKAKENITRFQTEKDYFIYNSKIEEIKDIASKTKAQKIPFNPKEKVQDSVVYFEPLLETAKLFSFSEDDVKRRLRSFHSLPHRLEYMGKIKGIKFYNDSAATIPEATVSAIKNLEKDLETLIVGGKDKGVDYKNLAEIIKRSNIQTLIGFPDTGNKIHKELKKIKGKINYYPVKTMQEAVEIGFKETKKGKICLLSPASSSFNMFENYKERGNLFKQLVKKNG